VHLEGCKLSSCSTYTCTCISTIVHKQVAYCQQLTVSDSCNNGTILSGITHFSFVQLPLQQYRQDNGGRAYNTVRTMNTLYTCIHVHEHNTIIVHSITYMYVILLNRRMATYLITEVIILRTAIGVACKGNSHKLTI